MKKELENLSYEIARKCGYKRPQNVEKQIERFWKNYQNKEQRKIRKELITLERIIADKNKLLHFNKQ